jgi:glutamate/tyrosine decarboxylase-like PLP-dependent enzyme
MPKTAKPSPLDNFQVSAQWSRRMNSLKLWLTLRVHGRQAYEELIDGQLKLASFFANWVRSSEHFELAAPQVLPIVNLRVKRSGAGEEQVREVHEAIVQEVTRDGKRWVSSTEVQGKSVMRMMVISYLTSHRHLEELMIALTEAAVKQAISK